MLQRIRRWFRDGIAEIRQMCQTKEGQTEWPEGIDLGFVQFAGPKVVAEAIKTKQGLVALGALIRLMVGKYPVVI